MTTLKKLLANKYGDLRLQILAAVLPLIAVIFAGPYALIVSYFAAGIAQYLSCIINRIDLPRAARHKTRTAYEIILLTLTAEFFFFLCIGYFEGITATMAVLLVAGPILAGWYMRITSLEARLLEEALKRKDEVT